MVALATSNKIYVFKSPEELKLCGRISLKYFGVSRTRINKVIASRSDSYFYIYPNNRCALVLSDRLLLLIPEDIQYSK